MNFINGNVSFFTGGLIKGGSIYINSTSTIDIIECNFYNNESPTSGGAIYVNNSVTNMVNVTLMNNKASFGGAIYLDYNNGNMIDIIFSNNIVDLVSDT